MALKSQIVFYNTPSGETKLDVRFDGNTVWLTQDQMASLFDKSKSTINEHLKNIYLEHELLESSTISKFGNSEFAKKPTNFYNLDAIISVGYRVKSPRGTQFRIWATHKIKEYIIKGFVMDDERLKNPDLPFDYFEELERRIADIRASEKRFYRKITDIYATSIDYDPTTQESITFFKTVQNKVHFAITGHTAAEIVVGRIDAQKPNLGLTNFRSDRPKKEELEIAKNYLDVEELRALNALVEQYLIFATEQARRRIPMYMQDWITKLHGFLTLNNRQILGGSGSLSHEDMLVKVNQEYQKHQEHSKDQDQLDFRISPDFEDAVKNISKITKKLSHDPK